ncbi:hypothetical protein [Longimicrobium terrae]|uniref:Carboxypeptidase regulatory-like domain-containing protein n=1 Tax=Longimicrobium terrae TaxID=1639882 RepID=A0A841H0E4_9BACT|nr:hypothetical protein [Longimicrobium terrae]MBB4636925.1 hypothetical protein [Longimicrobium terrae]MBB6071467.1 hypothetical protein [Longimicrobium terrae]NNC31316.1 hypothetical protein [Longimicrobium terrae]
MYRMIAVGGLLLALFAGGTAPAAAQPADSNRIVDVHVDVGSENQSFDGSMPEGGRFRLTIAGRGTFELSAVLVNAATRTFRVSVYSGAEHAASADLRLVERVDARQEASVTLRSVPGVSVVIDGTRARTTARQRKKQR